MPLCHRALTQGVLSACRINNFPSRLSLLAILVAITGSAIAAQQPEQDDVVRISTDLIIVPTTVFDSHGNRIPGLKLDDFVVFDDRQPTGIRHFAVASENVALSFLLDGSGSARDYAQKQRDAALALFQRFGSRSSISVTQFDETARIVVPFTRDLEGASTGFSFPPAVQRHTAIFDAAAFSIQLFVRERQVPIERRIVILMSDGLDTASQIKPSAIIERASKLGITFYVIQFPLFVPQNGHLVARSPSKGFKELAEKTSGKFFIAGDVNSALDPHRQVDLGPVFTAIEKDLASQYLIGFYPAEGARDGRPHKIEITLRENNRKYRVQTLKQEYKLDRQKAN